MSTDLEVIKTVTPYFWDMLVKTVLLKLALTIITVTRLKCLKDV